MAQLGSASALGAEGRPFESGRPDQQPQSVVSQSAAQEAPATPSPDSAQVSRGTLSETVETFLLTKRVEGAGVRTLGMYEWWLRRFIGTATQADVLTVRRFFADLQGRGMSASTMHHACRTLKTFFLFAQRTRALATNPLDGFHVRTPKTLPQLPTEDELRAVLAVCSETPAGKRNRAMLLVMADAGLRAAEVLGLLVEDWNPQERSLLVRGGKGGKDRVTFVTPTTARAIREVLRSRPILSREDYLFTTDDGKPLAVRYLLHVCHTLSRKAGLVPNRRLHPHALRHFAATSWLRSGVGLDEVRRLLGHSTLDTTLRYSSLVGADLQRAHRKAAAVERMRLD